MKPDSNITGNILRETTKPDNNITVKNILREAMINDSNINTLRGDADETENEPEQLQEITSMKRKSTKELKIVKKKKSQIEAANDRLLR